MSYLAGLMSKVIIDRILFESIFFLTSMVTLFHETLDLRFLWWTNVKIILFVNVPLRSPSKTLAEPRSNLPLSYFFYFEDGGSRLLRNVGNDLIRLCGVASQNTVHFANLLLWGPPLWSSGQSGKVRVRFPALPDFLRSSGAGTGSTQPREYN
jgi:hypothetical protein